MNPPLKRKPDGRWPGAIEQTGNRPGGTATGSYKKFPATANDQLQAAWNPSQKGVHPDDAVDAVWGKRGPMSIIQAVFWLAVGVTASWLIFSVRL